MTTDKMMQAANNDPKVMEVAKPTKDPKRVAAAKRAWETIRSRRAAATAGDQPLDQWSGSGWYIGLPETLPGM